MAKRPNTGTSKPLFQLQANTSTCAVYALLALVLTLLAFGNTPDLLLDTDDREYFETAVRSLKDPSLLFSADRHPTTIGRPVIDLVFLINYLLFQEDPVFYHIQVVLVHLLASLLLVYTFRSFGADLELGFLAGLLFLVHVAHFRGIHWIASIGYPLSLILSLGAIVCHRRWLQTDRRQIFTILLLALAIFTHPSAISVLLFCTYLTWRRRPSLSLTVRKTWPLVAITLFCGGLAYLLYPQSTQVAAVTQTFEPLRILNMLLWYISRLITSAHWLFVDLRDKPETWELGVGALALLGLAYLWFYRQAPGSDFAVWTFLAILPFINTDPGHRWTPAGPSRHLYFASLGSSFILAWGILSLGKQLGTLLGPKVARGVSGLLVLGILTSSIWALKRTEAISYYAAGRGYAARGDMETAVRQFEWAVKKDARLTPPDTYSRMVLALFNVGRDPMPFITKGLTLYPYDVSLKRFQGIWESHQAHPDIRQWGERHILEAFRLTSAKTELRQNAASAAYNLGNTYYRQENYEKAAEIYLHALKFNPRHTLARFYLGKSLKMQGNLQKALEVFQTAIQLRPNHGPALVELGNIFVQQNKLDEARAVYQKAAALGDSTARAALQRLPPR